jgi:hypothetical protein
MEIIVNKNMKEAEAWSRHVMSAAAGKNENKKKKL